MMLLGTQRVNSSGNLEIGGCDATRLAAEFGTPLYVIDEATFRQKCRDYRAAFEARYPRNVICYASKSFLTLAIARVVREEGLAIDVASLGELYTVLRSGFPPSRVNLHGNFKTRDELEMAVRRRIGHVVIDHENEIAPLDRLSREAGRKMRALVRCAPGVDPKTHRFISTGQADTKFGFNIADGSAMAAIRAVLASPNLAFDGIHAHIGSQLLDTESHEGAVDAVVGLMSDVRKETGVACPMLNIGGGLGVRYRSHHRPPSFGEFAEVVTSRLKRRLDEAGLPYPVLAQEPGRALIGEAGTTLYTVGPIRTAPILEAPGKRTYAAVDGGLSDNPRPQLYEAEYEVIVANKASAPHDEVVTIAGRHCETDILIWNARAAKLETGDILAVQTTGAYNHSMASNYNRFLRPAVVFVANGQAILAQERETLRDLVRRERLPKALRTPNGELRLHRAR